MMTMPTPTAPKCPTLQVQTAPGGALLLPDGRCIALVRSWSDLPHAQDQIAHAINSHATLTADLSACYAAKAALIDKVARLEQESIDFADARKVAEDDLTAEVARLREALEAILHHTTERFAREQARRALGGGA